jgi:TldD protein
MDKKTKKKQLAARLSLNDFIGIQYSVFFREKHPYTGVLSDEIVYGIIKIFSVRNIESAMINPKDIGLERLLMRSLKNGGDFSEVYIEDVQSTSIVSEAKRIEKYIATHEFGIGIRVVMGDRSAYAYTNEPTGLDALADTVAAAINQGQFKKTISLEKQPQRSFALVKTDPFSVDPEKKISMVKQAEDVAWKMDRLVKQVKVTYGEAKKQVLVANSRGFISEDLRNSILFLVHGVVAKDGIIETGYEPVGGSRGFELLDEITPEEIARIAIERGLRCLSARQAPAGMMSVVLSSEAGGTMVHEAIGHGLEADLAGEGLSVYAGRIGEQVASKAITVIDDATLTGKRGSFGYDDEGSPSEKTLLVENGVLKTYLTDLITAQKYNLPLTGNGRRQSFRHRPVPRMSNTMISPGTLKPEDVIAKAGKGIFVKKMGGGQVNTVNGDFVFEISEGYLIENGVIGEPIRGATLIGNGPQILNSIEHVGNDLGFAIGTCGKDGQGVPVGDAQPTLLIPEITVGGKIGG